MKELVVLRHAKSNRAYFVEDMHRPLSMEGIKRIKKISNKKSDFFKETDVIISSPANRALHTAIIIMNELNIDLDQLIVDKDLYTFSRTNVIDYVYALNEQWNKVVLVGHNPAFMETINHFSDAQINRLRTAGLAKITFDRDEWSAVYKGEILMGQKNNNI